MTETTHPVQSSVTFELGARDWKLAVMVTGVSRAAIRRKTVEAGDLVAVMAWVATIREKAHLPAATPVWSCYEAGRDGFWLHRALREMGIENRVLDAASIERPQKRGAKTDRLDAEALVDLLLRVWRGAPKAPRVVHVPSEAAEDARALHRELDSVKRARAAVSNRIGSLLATQGVRAAAQACAELADLRRWDGSPLPAGLAARLEREWAAYEALTARIRLIEAERRERLRTVASPAIAQVKQLMQLGAIGVNSAWLFVFEFFAWREFRNRRQVGALAGLTPTPRDSGEQRRELGLSGASNGRVRTMAIEIAWGWLRFQPDSALSRWYQARYGGGSPRLRRIGIVALARKLLIALWRYLDTGVLPEGAVVKA